MIAIAVPISAFVALGFEHCVANFYLLAIGMLSGAQVTIAEFLGNIASVTVGKRTVASATMRATVTRLTQASLRASDKISLAQWLASSVICSRSR